MFRGILYFDWKRKFAGIGKSRSVAMYECGNDWKMSELYMADIKLNALELLLVQVPADLWFFVFQINFIKEENCDNIWFFKYIYWKCLPGNNLLWIVDTFDHGL